MSPLISPSVRASLVFRSLLFRQFPSHLSATKSFFFSSSMEKSHQGSKDETDQLKERCTKEACELIGGGGKRRYSDDILPHLLNLYGSSATAADFEIYAPNASFEDPLMRAEGVKQIKSAFYSIPKLFTESRIIEYSVRENIISPGNNEILIDNNQFYKLFGRGIDMMSLIVLQVEEGKVVRHEDWWNKNPIFNRNTLNVPLVGRMMEMARRGSMMVTHAMMRFGKDPSQ